MKKLIIIFSLLVAGCVPSQSFFEVTAHNGLPVQIDTKSIISIVRNGTDCQVFFKNGIVLGVRNCDALKNRIDKIK